VTLRLLLDSGVLSEICHGKAERPVRAWFERISLRHELFVSDVADYEVRRGLVRARALRGIALLDTMPGRCIRVAMDGTHWHRAAEIWARLANAGRIPAKGLSGDTLLAAQALDLGATIVTYNLKDFAGIVSASIWTDVPIG
jgi:predicted nucleic acid-binding protein